jgi:hypothetical protein
LFKILAPLRPEFSIPSTTCPDLLLFEYLRSNTLTTRELPSSTLAPVKYTHYSVFPNNAVRVNILLPILLSSIALT